MNSYLLYHYSIIAMIIIFPLIGISIGQALLSKKFLEALNRQPHSEYQLSKMFLLSMVINETAALICVLFGILFTIKQTPTFFGILAEIGTLLAVAVPSFFIGIAASWPGQAAFIAVARQPFIAQSITNTMIITQIMIQTPVLLGLVVSLIMQAQLTDINVLADSLRIIASGLVLCLGALGPVQGLAHFSHAIITNMGLNQQAQEPLQTFTFIGAGFIETPLF